MPNWSLELPCQDEDEDEPTETERRAEQLSDARERIKFLERRIAELEAKLGPDEPF